MYDKAGNVLRFETTVGNPEEFKVYRPKQTVSERDNPDQTDSAEKPDLAWLPMRKGVADLHRRAEVSQESNTRYAEALSVTQVEERLGTSLDRVGHCVQDGKRTLRALRIGPADDIALLEAISQGEHAIAGFRNADIRACLYPSKNASGSDRKRQAARTSRLLRLLRAHGLIQKVQKSHRYRLTTFSHKLTAAVFALRNAPLERVLRAVTSEGETRLAA